MNDRINEWKGDKQDWQTGILCLCHCRITSVNFWNRWSCCHFLDVPYQLSWYRCDREKKRTSDSCLFSIKFIYLHPTDPIFSLNLWTNQSKSRTSSVFNFRHDVNMAMVKDELFWRIRVFTKFVDLNNIQWIFISLFIDCFDNLSWILSIFILYTFLCGIGGIKVFLRRTK